MKKIFSILLTALLFLGLSTSVYAATDKEHAKGLQLIEKANFKIDKKIEKGVAEADKLQGNYLLDLEKVEAKLESSKR